MINQPIDRLFRSFWSGFKALLFTRLQYDAENKSSCEINCDLSDKNTFFAWQRNHMANERTFLAWCRTGISLIVFGFVIERFDILLRESVLAAPGGLQRHADLPGAHLMGMVALGLGVLIIFLAGWRFFYLRRHINNGDARFSVVPDTFLLSSVLITVAASFVFFAFYV